MILTMTKYHENLLRDSPLSSLSIVRIFSSLETKMILKIPNETFSRITRYLDPRSGKTQRQGRKGKKMKGKETQRQASDNKTCTCMTILSISMSEGKEKKEYECECRHAWERIERPKTPNPLPQIPILIRKPKTPRCIFYNGSLTNPDNS